MRNKVLITSLTIIGFAIIAFYATNWFKEFVAIDSCLDKGGKWNYELKKCEFSVDSVDVNIAYWIADYNDDMGEYLIRGKQLDSIEKTPEALIDILNGRELECSLEYKGIQGDTICIGIINGLYLSEQMGTTGAYCFLGETIFTLTELDSINKVSIEMEVGSHAGPGVYTRNDFDDLVKE
ncbi:hypothetical protein [Marinifilum fragile]|uniref:hypothetical protein n=1 Tax=Marinifilum fragile TaxID=570161 RepID=UPI0006CF9B05|nr:hypothetical protein [Marinifilum fragile]